jgi:hypothetical protein
MDIDRFLASLETSSPPDGTAPPLRALWLEANGDWNGAHETVQAETTAEAAWVYAYLHRVEGDEANAGYWYRRAAQPHCRLPLADEWTAIAKTLLKAN